MIKVFSRKWRFIEIRDAVLASIEERDPSYLQLAVKMSVGPFALRYAPPGWDGLHRGA